jgi:hypothetical protein
MAIDESTRLYTDKLRQARQILGGVEPINRNTKRIVEFNPSNDYHRQVAYILFIERDPAKIAKLDIQFKNDGVTSIFQTVCTRIAEFELRKFARSKNEESPTSNPCSEVFLIGQDRRCALHCDDEPDGKRLPSRKGD